MEEAPRSEVEASLRDLHSGSNELPWTRVILHFGSTSGQKGAVRGPDGACSRDANGCSVRVVPARIIAAKPVAKRPSGGVVGVRANGTGRRKRGASGVGSRVGGIGSGFANGPSSRGPSIQPSNRSTRQLTRNRRARASAQSRNPRKSRRGRVVGRVATNSSRWRMNIRASDSAGRRAAWLCVACWIGSRVIDRVVGVVVLNA